MPSPHVIATPTAANLNLGSALPPNAVSPRLTPAALTSLPRAALQVNGHGSNTNVPAPSPDRLVTDQPLLASAITSPDTVFSGASLPRTSSLLPPPHLPNSATPRANAVPTLAAPPAPVTEQTTSSTRRPSISHSRSSSIGGLAEGFRSLNRWSSSTTSSKASGSNPSRRPSSDENGPSANPAPHTPRKLQKSRQPSITSESPRNPAPLDSQPQKPVPALLGLPPIVSLPSLEQEVEDEASNLANSEAGQQPTGDDGNWGHAHKIGASEVSPITPTPNTMAYERNGDAFQLNGHSRNRSNAAKGSTDTSGSSRGKDRSNKSPSSKTMLSRALQKANAAVQLDNAQNLDGARQSYAEACDLLQQVLNRTSGDEDKRKLEAIRRTYTSRIEELDMIVPSGGLNGKALPDRPANDAPKAGPGLRDEDRGRVPMVEAARAARMVKDIDRGLALGEVSPPQDSRAGMGRSPDGSRIDHYALQSSFSRSPVREPITDGLILQQPTNDRYVPPSLSPQRQLSPRRGRGTPEMDASRRGHDRAPSQDSVSWLDPIDESEGSVASSVHSRSSMRIRRKHIRAPSGDTEAEFDAALDAAVEAAYDEGYEPMEPDEMEPIENGDDIVANALRKVQLAKERVRQTEREARELEKERERRRKMKQEHEVQDEPGVFYDGDSSEEEERIFEEMSRDYSVDEFVLQPQGKPPLTRESGSSGLTSRTWYSSQGSNPPTATTTLSTVTEGATVPPLSKSPVLSAPPPGQPRPEPPSGPGQLAANGGDASRESVRNRRLSGQNLKQLKIETRIPRAPQAPSAASMASMSPTLADSPTAESPQTPPQPFSAARGLDDTNIARSGSPAAMPTLRKNFSSSSLRSMRSRNMSVSHLDDASDMSPGTPLSNHFGSNSRLPAVPALPTIRTTSFREAPSESSAAGMYLFDDNLHSPFSPGSPNPLAIDAPMPLEPCPSDFTLRPFWLMRCLYQTVAHPRGGYLTNKLFIPRDVWKVKGVKLRNVEDKMAGCDLLTAALLKLARVDTCDADAVFEEMQSFESILELVQSNLSRKLGTEVGAQSANVLFKDMSGPQENDSMANVPRSSSVSAKSPSAFSWRRLRTKNSAVGLANAYNGKGSSTDGSKDSLNLLTLPMTANPTSKQSKRDVSQVQFTGPNAAYMGSLARLFDAAQTIDQIARQVEDPGLRHADKTQVGLELCTRHAAEFFGFVICRFVLADLNMLLDKFVKRGSEWVLS